ncbi:hypothetical protein R75461_08256 [Paraburkholderia nemoris]|uniref:hypothetical protein n=1 Tax=Paraburkholderia nemoris TaxID=2793076 RepID=UPI00190B58D7|nr:MULTISPECIES: hypothetical protein [Paraburkholderia]MBK3787197.1 hypothetical protein [Paraburkholderia aspalathi]CAE6865609.1 hypothetical protein R75461_08256 [Paraburkholderia nemoris]
MLRLQDGGAKTRLRHDMRARAEFPLHMVASKAFGEQYEVSTAGRATMRRVVTQILDEAARFYGFGRDVDLIASHVGDNACGLTFELAQEALQHFPDWALEEMLARLAVAQRV